MVANTLQGEGPRGGAYLKYLYSRRMHYILRLYRYIVYLQGRLS